MKEKLKYLFLIIIIIGNLSLIFAQSAQPEKSPKLFQPAVISIAVATAYRPTFTPSGKTIYYTIEAGANEYVILQSNLRGNRWTKPEIVSFSGRYSDAEAFLSPDGTKMVFASKRPVAGDKPKNDYDLWIADQLPDGKWNEPHHLGDSVNSEALELYPSLTRDGTLYFVRSDANGNDIWRSRFSNGRYDKAEKLPAPVNTDRREAGVYIAPDENFMIFESNREGTIGGTDFFISFNRAGQWTEPKSLGASINSQFQETSAMLSPDGKTIFFASNRRLPTAARLGADLNYAALVRRMTAHGNGKWHIYSADFNLSDFLPR